MKVALATHCSSCKNLISRMGMEYTSYHEDADIIIFPGGADISPMLYGALPHHSYWPSNGRDEIEVSVYNHRKPHQILIGICRGAQLIHAMQGGKLWQDVTGHWNGCHDVTYKNNTYNIISLHHQMLQWDSTSKGKLLSSAGLTSYNEDNHPVVVQPEVVVYPNMLCFQSHPEYSSMDDTYKLFADVLFDEFNIDVRE